MILFISASFYDRISLFLHIACQVWTIMRENKQAFFEVLFKAYHTRLYFYAFNIINDQASAEDIVEDVFGYIWENYEDMVKDISPLPLLYSLTKSRCIDYLRHNDVKERFRESMLKSQSPASYETAEENNDHHQRITQVMQAIKELPPQTRKVFEACFFHGKKYKEVSGEMNISVNTVKTHITRALSFIRKYTGESSGIN